MSTTRFSEITAGISSYVREITYTGKDKGKGLEYRMLLARCHVIETFIFNNFEEHRTVIDVQVCNEYMDDPNKPGHTFRRSSIDLTYWQ